MFSTPSCRSSAPIKYDASQGATFEVHFTKSRGFWGDDAAPFEARLIDGKWMVGEIAVDDSVETMRALQESGASIREIRERLGMSKSVVARKLKGGQESASANSPSPTLSNCPSGTP